MTPSTITTTTTTTSTTSTTTTTITATWERCACEHVGHRTFSDCVETNICECRGEVRYGYGDTWSNSKQVDGSIECSNGFFGDPLFGQAKECQCKQGSVTTTSSTTTPTTTTTTSITTTTSTITTTTTTTSTTSTTTTTSTATWERCACEHVGHRTFSDCVETNICECRGEVRYGYGDTWSNSKQVDGSIVCSNGVFGDPFFLQAKECQCKQGSVTTTSSTSTTPC